MYNLNSELNKFYRNNVLLDKSKRKELRDKKDLNIERLKSGLKEYNEENSTTYNIVDHVVQGSIAMLTITQNDNNDYDIDTAIIFEKDNIPDGSIASKNFVHNSLSKKTSQFTNEPELKTNCITLKYEDAYHIDFAVYRRYRDSDEAEFNYEHAGSQWRDRNPRSITKWFNENNKNKNYKLRKIVQLLKMFCKSRTHWKMPGGLIQSVLVNECFVSDNRFDLSFYETIKAIKTRLESNTEILNPVNGLSLIHVGKDESKIQN